MWKLDIRITFTNLTSKMVYLNVGQARHENFPLTKKFVERTFVFPFVFAKCDYLSSHKLFTIGSSGVAIE